MILAEKKDYELLRELGLDENNYTKVQREDMAYKVAMNRQFIADVCESFDDIDDLIDDHKELKIRINKWERQLDGIHLGMLLEYKKEDVDDWAETIEEITQDMSAINN